MGDPGQNWPKRYRHFPDLEVSNEDHRFALRPVQWSDREAIRSWRNSQIDVLRQVSPLSETDQDTYFSAVVFEQFDQLEPPQILFAFLENGQLVGCGGLVHIVWSDNRAEVSFLTDPKRLDAGTFAQDWIEYLKLLIVVAKRLGLHKLTTETYSIRMGLVSVLEGFGFEREGILREHHLVGEKYVDSYAHGFVIN